MRKFFFRKFHSRIFFIWVFMLCFFVPILTFYLLWVSLLIPCIYETKYLFQFILFFIFYFLTFFSSYFIIFLYSLFFFFPGSYTPVQFFIFYSIMSSSVIFFNFLRYLMYTIAGIRTSRILHDSLLKAILGKLYNKKIILL